MILHTFNNQGFTNNLNVFKELGVLDKIKQKIYENTKDNLEDHETNLSLDQKLKLKFKKKVSIKYINDLRRLIHYSDDFDKIINSEEVKEKFRLIFKKPILFKVNIFRALLPTDDDASFPYHQDEATWFLFKDNFYQNKLMGTMWLSINGANKSNSIELLKGSHKYLKLFNHQKINEKGYFGGVMSKKILENHECYQVETQTGEAIIFHNLTFHRTINNKNQNNKMLPRYSIDIRYYEKDAILKYDINYIFKLKKFISRLNTIK